MKEHLLIDSSNVRQLQENNRKDTIVEPRSHSQFLIIDCNFDASCQTSILTIHCSVDDMDATFKDHENFYFYDQSLDALANYNLRRLHMSCDLNQQASEDKLNNGVIVQRVDNNIYILDDDKFYFKVHPVSKYSSDEDELYFINSNPMHVHQLFSRYWIIRYAQLNFGNFEKFLSLLSHEC